MFCVLCIERLVADFIADEVKSHSLETPDSVGEVNLAMDVYSHPNSGELDGTMRGKGSSGGGEMNVVMMCSLASHSDLGHGLERIWCSR